MPLFIFIVTFLFVDGIRFLVASRLIVPIIAVFASFGIWEEILRQL